MTRGRRQAGKRGALEAKSILIIEDEENISRILRFNLEMEGYRVLVAEDGEAGFKAALEHRPDLITLDVLMPRRNGWETLRDLRGDERTRDIPVMMITVVGEPMKAVELGAEYYLVKPFRFEQVLEVVRGELGRPREGNGDG